MCHIEWQVAHCFLNCHAVGPEGEWCNGQPAGGVAVASFDKGLLNGAVLVLDDAVHLQVVSQNVYMMDTVPFGKPVKCSNIGGAIVHDDFLNGTPPAEDLFKQEGADGMPILDLQCMPFWPSGERSVSLDNVPTAVGTWHEHCVDVCFAK
jgi:hypothetical protein